MPAPVVANVVGQLPNTHPQLSALLRPSTVEARKPNTSSGILLYPEMACDSLFAYDILADICWGDFEEGLSFLIKRDGLSWCNPSSFLFLLILNVDLTAEIGRAHV